MKCQYESTLLSLCVALAAAGCPPTYERFGESCYKYVREKAEMKFAEQCCSGDNGLLVTIESSQEQAFLDDYLRRHGKSVK